ncbi:HAD family hydrolase [Aquipuribacter nitratireducens]|uniref:HAD family hydrolase n=1 Tax=Aquipuribacter nitratireducens TaxID=650104 RepID=A0ABW0GLU6_9MICO
MSARPLPSWRDGPARASLLGFLADSARIAPEDRLAVLDVDGTLWCEKPRYVQLDFLLDQLTAEVARRPDLRERAELRAVIEGDDAAVASFGLPRVAAALVELFEGQSPGQFSERVRRFVRERTQPELGVPYRGLRYRPMLELLDALRAAGFDVALVTGGGAEFVRAVALDFFGVPPQSVVGTQIAYRVVRDGAGRPALLRTSDVDLSGVNEGPAKVANIQRVLGRAPVFAAGNSPGDVDMLQWAGASGGPSLSLLVEHDDPEREVAYESVAGSFDAAEPVAVTAQRWGWTTASVARDWETVLVGA